MEYYLLYLSLKGMEYYLLYFSLKGMEYYLLYFSLKGMEYYLLYFSFKVYGINFLTLILLNLNMPCHCKQCRSRSVGFWSGSALFVIKYVNSNHTWIE